MKQISILSNKEGSKPIVFQGVNRLFVLSFEDNAVRKGHTWYFNPKVEVKDYNVMMNERNFFDQPVKTDIETYNKSQKKKKKIPRFHGQLSTRLSLFQRTL